MVRLALVGGTGVFHALAFGGLVNGTAPGKSVPDGWPDYPQSVENARITVVWDEDRAAAEKLAEVFGIEHVADTLEAVVPHCDGVIVTVDATAQHYRHAPFFLERGIPTFIDKPLAPDAKTAQSLVELAAKHGTPLMSGSALRYAAESEALRANPDLLGRIELATAFGPNDLFNYGLHPLELAHSIMGGGIATVRNVGTQDQDIVKVTYHDGRTLILIISRVLKFAFEITFYGTDGRQSVVVSDDTAYYSNQLRQIATMIRDRKTPYPIEDAVEVIRILEAGVLSLQQGGKEIAL
ncbi:MAG TPA: Gfo/Idh/MocA family oxidoreductase [Abditibacteriaceae bacterium]|jgi:predicted dehydrogenase